MDHDKYRDFKFLDGEGEFKVEVANDVWIGASVKIMERVHIGDGAVVAAGMIVMKNIPPYTIVDGVFVKVIKYWFSKEQIDMLMKINGGIKERYG